MKLYLIRHGETFANLQNLIQGQYEDNLSELNEKGIWQAQKLGEYFKEKHIDVIYASDLKRAIRTAQEVAKFHPKLNVKQEKLLRERYFGDLEGKKSNATIDWANIPNGESRSDVQKRAKQFLDKISEKHKNKTVVVVCHSGMKKAFLRIFHNLNADDPAPFHPKNTSISSYELDNPNTPNILFENNYDHLD